MAVLNVPRWLKKKTRIQQIFVDRGWVSLALQVDRMEGTPVDNSLVAHRRKRSRSVGSIDSDTPDEYYVELNELQDSSGIADKGWSKTELSKIAKISENMLSSEQEENI